MPVTQYLSILFSRPRWRHFLLAGLLIHLLVGGYALATGIVHGVNLSLVMDTVQFFLIQAGLVLLYGSSSRMESVRYSLDTQFYIKQYREEQHRLLAMTRKASGPFEPRFGISQADYRNLPNRKDIILSQSVLEQLPAARTRIQQLKFRLEDSWYDLPWMISAHALDITLKRFNAIEKYDYNGLLLAVKGIEEGESDTTLVFHKATYYSYLATNMLPELTLPGGLTYRDLLKPGPQLSTLDTSLPENHLGLSCLYRTTDGYLIVPRRSKNTNVFKGQLSPSVSGASNIQTCLDRDTKRYSPLAWLMKETEEELPFLFADPERGLNRNRLKALLGNSEYLGMTRELRRCGKPEVFFFCELPLSANDIHALLARQNKGQSAQPAGMSDIQSIDLNENAGFFLIKEAAIYTNLNVSVKGGGKRFLSKRAKPTVYRTLLAHEGDQYEVSESLFVNLLLLKAQASSTELLRDDNIEVAGV
ncbi:hypothetical protein [Halomonas sp. BC04]|uniref:hypothetical protein n=1 Tax=Halomonas sp. BC04 TaxID=1403540 RepID=UPI0003ED6280|nr:hypothetical protein [Halomonas sp. BC04]EWH00144.1 hypothetical protein Q427_21045 [Halomonas sp. BC04]